MVILNALQEKPIPVYGEGKNIRDWLYVEDHVRALIAVLETGRIGETYNIGSQNEQTNLDIVKHLCRTLDEIKPRPNSEQYEDLITFVADRPGHDLRYAIDPAKIETELDWKSFGIFRYGNSENSTMVY